MKKRISLFLVLVLLCGLLCGCGAATKSSSYSNDTASTTNDAALTVKYEIAASDERNEYDVDYDAGGAAMDTSVIAGAGIDSDVSDKMIYTAYAEIETTEFEDSVSAVYDLLDSFGAFVEDSYVTGKSYSTDYYGYQSYRSARFVLRVPKESYKQLLSELGGIGNVLSLDSSSRNITTQYTDTESRLKTYRIEEQRLQEMLQMAESVEDMITIESRLSEVRYEIESLTSTLREWDNQVDYSTVTLSISEVRKLTERYPAKRSYWQEIGDGILATLSGIGEFFKSLFMYFMVALPVLVILAVIVVVIILIVKAAVRRKRKKLAESAMNQNTQNQ